ncbi:MAG: sporulation peptidase YabG [Candidatus Carbobacillus altaicus]|nr:sporulation peptidase YabG [Candidatus Carbobacillus altaicus]
MQEIRVGSVVARKSYGKDIAFRVIQIHRESSTALLQGIDWRLLADAPLSDLALLADRSPGEPSIYQVTLKKKLMNDAGASVSDRPVEEGKDQGGAHTPYQPYPGTVLHLDGDPRYLFTCLRAYEQLGIPAVGLHLDEREMPRRVVELLKTYEPDVLVLTGHDALRARAQKDDIKSYRHSKYFIEAVKRARREYERHKDALVIFAGACQSHYEAIIAAGANFASSPSRVNIHALDPIFVVAKLAFASVRHVLPPLEVIQETRSGEDGIGGIESRGLLRLGLSESHPD